jgi:2-haloacid dehalogenase
MPQRPHAAICDVIGTLFPLDPLRSGLAELGLPPLALEAWFAEALRDSFALAATDRFQPLRDMLGAALDNLCRQHEAEPEAPARQALLDSITILPPAPDAAASLDVLLQSGIHAHVLTNGAAAQVEAMLRQARLRDSLGLVLSAEEVGLVKPREEIYRHAVQRTGIAPRRLALITVHPWDVHGAKAAGLMAAYVRRGRPFPPTLLPPDIEAEELGDAAAALAALRG